MNATLGSRVTLGLLEACRERDMSFGYIEFLGLSLRIPGGLLVISWIFLDFMGHTLWSTNLQHLRTGKFFGGSWWIVPSFCGNVYHVG